MTGKQRRYLKSLAHSMEPAINIGKYGVTDNFIQQIQDLLEKRELVKIKILNNNMDDQDTIVAEILERTGCEFVQAIGFTWVIYKESKKPTIILPQ